MYTVEFPDWKRIGKKLRDIFYPPGDNGPSREERRAQRLKDASRGFVYFDDFEELRSWTNEAVDPIQQSNTPLLPRCAHSVYNQKADATSVLVCHDYSGGYHAYESVRPRQLETVLYSCNYPQFIETFVYFSHKLVCVPPPTWVNTMHRNGVGVLGTFLIEPQTPQIERMFERRNGDYVVSEQLAAIAYAYGFDGWLLNIEGEFPSSVSNPFLVLSELIRSLKKKLDPSMKVIWYDALTSANRIDHQNSLTSKNVAYTLAAGNLFTNYKSTEHELTKSEQVAGQYGIGKGDIYFGVDVWAQNTDMSGNRRVTYPPKGGGGTNTGVVNIMFFNSKLYN